MMGKRKFILCLVAAFLVGAAVTGGIAAIVSGGAFGYVRVAKSDYDDMAEVYERYGKLNSLYDAVEASFYKDVDGEDMMEGAYKGLIAGLGDPYSSYMTEEEYENGRTPPRENTRELALHLLRMPTGSS